MLKEVFASNAAKMIAACVCPVVATSAIVLKVPEVRSAIHRATSPKVQPHRQARALPRVRKPVELARAEAPDALAPAMMCTRPAMLQDAPISTMAPLPLTTVDIQTRTERVYAPSNCAPVSGIVTTTTRAMNAVPEPATWAQMIAGFALLGGTLRAGRRRTPRFA